MSTTAETGTTGRKSGAPTFYISTVGCAKNEVDSDAMRARLLAAGYDEVAEPDEADVCLVNTCGFLAEATQESIEVTLEAAGLRRRDGAPKVVMCGCVPSRYGAELEEELPEVDAFVRADDEGGIVSVVERLVGAAPVRGEFSTGVPAVLRTTGDSVAFVKIAEGCDRRCTFCAIPGIRGPLVSRPAGEVVEEARHLVDAGAREIVLVAQDTSSWGHDLPGRPTLASLLADLGRSLAGTGAWIRVLYVQPEGLTDGLIETFVSGFVRNGEGVLPYIDLPLQHCSRDLLARMGRRGDRESFLDLVSLLRERIPGVVLRTTVICGFPGETEREHGELLDFLREAAFDYVAVFAYSPEEGTPAAAMDDQVDEGDRLRWTQEAMDVAEELGFASAARRVGTDQPAVVDALSPGDVDGPYLGHCWFQAPDADGVVHLSGDGLAVGDRVMARIVDSWCYDLEGEVDHGDGAPEATRP